MMSSNIDITEVVFEGSWINAIIGIIFYCNNDFSGGWLRSVNNDFAFTLSNVAILNIYVNLSIFVALVCYISANNGTINLGSSPLAFDGALRESPPPAWRKMRTKKDRNTVVPIFCKLGHSAMTALMSTPATNSSPL